MLKELTLDDQEKQEITARIANLSPTKRALLEKRLNQPQAKHHFIPRVVRAPYMPLSFGQERLYFLSKLNADSPVYNRPLAIQLVGKLDSSSLILALERMVKRYEILRTTFLLVNGSVAQHINEPFPLTCSVVDLLVHPNAESEYQQLSREWIEQPFNLEQGPLIRAKLFHMSSDQRADKHRLLLVMHHLIFDGWSSNVFINELTVLYASIVNGFPTELPSLSIQYADFACWQRDTQQNPVDGATLNYWMHQLSGELPTLELPADRSRPVAPSLRGATHKFLIPDDLVRQLSNLGRQLQVTPFAILLAAFKILLYRYTGQDDLLVGSLTSGRTHTELENQLGMFTNTVVIRSHFLPDLTFEALLVQVWHTVLDALKNQEVPFEHLLNVLRPERDLSHNPLFQVSFNYEDFTRALPAEDRMVDNANLKAEEFFADNEAALLDLSLEILAQPNRPLIGVFQYSTELFNSDRIARMADHFLTLLSAAIADPSQAVSRLTLLTAAERQLFAQWNHTTLEMPFERTIGTAFAAQVRSTPNHMALLSKDQSITYSELDLMSNQFAHYLLSLNVHPRNMVAVSIGHAIGQVIAFLGVVKAGCVYVPIDPSNPAERNLFLLNDAQAPVLIVSSTQATYPTAYRGQVVDYDAIQETLTRYPDNAPNILIEPEDTAFMIYTSGSTGQPKGALVQHLAVLNNIFVSCKAYKQEPGKRVLQLCAISFDISVHEILTTLLSGGTLVIHPDAMMQSVHSFMKLCVQYKIDILMMPTAYWRELTAYIDQTPYLSYLRQFTCIMTAGERMPPEDLRSWQKKVGPQVPLINGYGPTETAMLVSMDRVEEAETATRHISVGRPFPNTQFYVLDANEQIMPVGVSGELYIGGVQVGQGYWQRPELTINRFVPDPFHSQERLYRTGDLASYRPDGNLEIIGRTDNQVKIRGVRVEPGEIESAVQQHPAVTNAAVIIRTSPSLQFYAFVVTNSETLTSAELKQYLESRLPSFMIPARFIFLKNLPLNTNGKVDYKALPEPTWEPEKHVRVAPRDNLEQKIAAIWGEVFGTNDVSTLGIYDDFFALGGHSLLAIQIVSRLEQALGKSIPLATFFFAPTIAEIAQHIRDEQATKPASCLIPIQPDGTRPPLFCMPPINGGVFSYQGLIAVLGNNQPIYGLQSRGMDGEAEPFGTVDEMVTAFLQDIRSVQAHGPYFLCGYSFGGRVALEIAQALHASGETVAFLGLIATRFKYQTIKLAGRPRTLRWKLSTAWFTLTWVPRRYWRKYLRDWLSMNLSLKRFRQEPIEKTGATTYTASISKVRSANAAISRHSELRPYYDEITYFFALDDQFSVEIFKDLHYIAKGPLEIIDVPGRHGTVMNSDYVATVGNALRDRLDRFNKFD